MVNRAQIDAVIAKAVADVMAGVEHAPSKSPVREPAVNESPIRVITDLASHMEHSVLNPDFCTAVIRKACAEAKEHRFANVCVTPYHLETARRELEGANIGICVPVGFPHAAASTEAKLTEIRQSLLGGATELDVALCVSAVKSGDYEYVERELRRMVDLVNGRAAVKAIYEQWMYTEDEGARVLELAVRCGADYIKISNFLTGDKAVPEDVTFVRGIIGNAAKIKIDGGVKDAATARALIEAGADRIGASASVKIVSGAE